MVSLQSNRKELRQHIHTVLVSFLSTWHTLESFGKREPLLRKMLLSDWPTGKVYGSFLDYDLHAKAQPTVGGIPSVQTILCLQKGVPVEEQHSSMSLHQFLFPGSCSDSFSPWSIIRTCKPNKPFPLQTASKQTLSSVHCFQTNPFLCTLLLVMSFYHSNRKLGQR